MLKWLKLRSVLSVFIFLKKGIGSLLTGGIHIKPCISKSKFLHNEKNSLSLSGCIPDFCGSSPMLIWINILGFF